MQKQNDFPNTIVVLPSLNPTQQLSDTIDSLIESGFTRIVVVNDGSDTVYDEIFKELQSNEYVTLLTHESNLGKGCALKTAFKYILENCADVNFIATADADGQHLAQDIANCCKEAEKDNIIILGARDFSQTHVPKKSRFGNTVTSFIFKNIFRININDTQTGLRIIPAKHLDFLLNVRGSRFEYETNMLLDMKDKAIAFREVPITTVYEGNNEGTHFNTVQDAFLIYINIFRFLVNSVISFLIDNSLFYILLLILAKMYRAPRIVIAAVIARLISSLVNYLLNKNAVFKNTENHKSTLPKYIMLVSMLLSVSVAAVVILSGFLAKRSPFMLTTIKVLLDLLLLIASYNLQKHWVFKST